MRTKNIIVIGAGVGGQLAAYGIAREFPAYKVLLIGPKTDNPKGLFYFNREIPGLNMRRIPVNYELIGEGSLDDYQVKSRGYKSNKLSTSSFNHIGKEVDGYLLESDSILLSNISQLHTSIDLIDREKSKIITTENEIISYDYLISTIPLISFIRTSELPVIFTQLSQKFYYNPVYIRTTNYSEDQVSKILVRYDLTDSIFYRHSIYSNSEDEVIRTEEESIIDFEDKTTTMFPGKIVPSHTLSEYVSQVEDKYPNIKLCGRYARWDYHYTVDQTYYDSLEFIRDT